jgi:hypothetical protein
MRNLEMCLGPGPAILEGPTILCSPHKWGKLPRSPTERGPRHTTQSCVVNHGPSSNPLFPLLSSAMIRPRLVLFLLFAAGMLLAAQTATRKTVKAAAEKDPRSQFVGTWKLVSSTEVLPDGTRRAYGFGSHPQGYLVYDATGHMCAQVVNSDRPKWKDPEHPTPEEIKTAFDGFGGYCGTYTIDEKNSTLVHMPEVPFDPNLVGSPKPRTYRFENGQLIYTGSEPFEQGGETHWTMIWEKVTK